MNEHLIKRATPGQSRFRVSTLIAQTLFGAILLPAIFATGRFPPDPNILGHDQVITIYVTGSVGGASTFALCYLLRCWIDRIKERATDQKNNEERG